MKTDSTSQGASAFTHRPPLVTTAHLNNNYLLAPAAALELLKNNAAAAAAMSIGLHTQTQTSLESAGSYDYLTRVYLATMARNKLEALNEAEKTSQIMKHLHKGADYRVCPCASCQAVRISILQMQQTTSPISPVMQASNKQHFLLPYKTPTGATSYISVCSDQSNCLSCQQLSPGAAKPISLPAAATLPGVNLNNAVGLQSPTATVTDQYLATLAQLASPTANSQLPVSGHKSPVVPVSSSASPVADNITCNWTEANSTPCGMKFQTEDQLFSHIKQAHTACGSPTAPAPKPRSPVSSPQHTGLLTTVSAAAAAKSQASSNPLASLTNFSRKALAETSTSSADGGAIHATSLATSRYHPYARPTHLSRGLVPHQQQHPSVPASLLLPAAQTSLPAPQLPFSSLTALPSALSMAPYLFAAAR